MLEMCADEHSPEDASACWTCGNPANSGDHRVKRAALVALFGEQISQATPLYYRSGNRKKRVGTLKADRLKFPQDIAKATLQNIVKKKSYRSQIQS